MWLIGSRSGAMSLAPEVGSEHRPAFEHGAGDARLTILSAQRVMRSCEQRGKDEWFGDDHNGGFTERLDDGTVGDLDSDPRDLRLCSGRRDNPVGLLGKAGTAVAKDPFREHCAGAAHDTGLVAFGAPADTGKPFKIIHGIPFAALGSRAAMMPSDPCTGARGTNSPLGVHHGRKPYVAECARWRPLRVTRSGGASERIASVP